MPVVAIVLRCLQACGYFCQAAACGVETCRTIWQTITKICTCGQGWKGMASNAITLFTSEEDPDFDKDFDLPVTISSRPFTDVPALLALLALLTGMGYAMNRSLVYGRPEVFTHGVDSFTNICGYENNLPYSEISNSGRNMTEFPLVLLSEFFLHPTQVSLTRNFDEYTYLCVKSCPSSEEGFACETYMRVNTPYGPSVIRILCLTVTFDEPPTFDIISNRCVPSEALENTTTRFQNSLLNFYSNNWISNLVHDCYAARVELTWLVLISLASSCFFLLVVHVSASSLCLYSYTTFSLTGVATTGYLWYLYYRLSAVGSGVSLFSDGGVGDFDEADESSEPQTSYLTVFLIISILTTVIVGVLLIAILLVGSRNKDACSVLFDAATSCTIGLKWVYVFPLVTLVFVALALLLWVYTLMFLTAIFEEQPQVFSNPTGFVQGILVPDISYINFILVFEFVTIFWVIHFLVGCQSLLTNLTVGTYYFTIRKQDMYRPTRVALSRLIRRHVGSAAAGGFIIGFFGLLKAPLSLLQSRILTATDRVLKEEQALEEAAEQSVSDEFYSPTPSAGLPLQKYRKNIFFYPSGARYSEKRPSDDRRWSNESPVRFSTRRSYATKPNYDAEVGEEKVENHGTAVDAWLCVNKCCSPCFWALEHVFAYTSDLNYAVVALEGFCFFRAGRWLRDRLEGDQRLKGIIPISSFALFLQKLTASLVILPIGFILLKDKEEVFLYGFPLAVSAIISFLIAHVFFSLFEAATGAVFVCYIEDTYLNDGDYVHPYFGEKSFFEDFENALEEIDVDDAPPYTKIHVGDVDEEAGIQVKTRKTREPSITSERSDFYALESEDEEEEEDEFSDPVIVTQPRKSSVRRDGDEDWKDRPQFRASTNRPSQFRASTHRPSQFRASTNRPSRLKPPQSTDLQRPSQLRDSTNRPSRLPADLQRPSHFRSSYSRKSRVDRDENQDKLRRSVKQESVGDSTGFLGPNFFDKIKENIKFKPDDEFSTDEFDEALDVDDVWDQVENTLDETDRRQQRRQGDQQRDKKDREKGRREEKLKTRQKDTNQKGDGRAKQGDTKRDVKKADTGKGTRGKNLPKKKPPDRPPPPKTPPKKPPARPPPPKQLPKKPPARPPPPKQLPKKPPARPPPPKRLPKKPPARPPRPNFAAPKAPKPPPRPKKAAFKAGKSKFADTKKLKSPKLKAKLGKSKIPRFRKGPDSSRVGANLKRPNLGNIQRGGAFKGGLRGGGVKGGFKGGGGAAGALGGAMRAVNIADGMLRIAGKKDEAREAVENVAHATRGRSKATNLLTHIVDNRYREFEDQSGPWYNPKVLRTWKMNKDLFVDGKKILEDTDKAWDEIENAEQEEESEEEREPRRRRRRSRKVVT